MRKTFIVLACIASTSAAAIEASQHATPPSRATGDSIQVAQACGWYAIYYCSPGRSQAVVWANHNRGRVINTSSRAYPNFAGGYYCVVDGPMGRSAALSAAQRMRRVAPTAYAKNAC